jgi:hypothetical protein
LIRLGSSPIKAKTGLAQIGAGCDLTEDNTTHFVTSCRMESGQQIARRSGERRAIKTRDPA